MVGSKKRPGVEAAIRLALSTDPTLWQKIEKQYDSIRSSDLKKADQCCREVLGDQISKDDLLNLVQWKFAVGKPRPQNLGLLRSNSEASVKQASQKAIKMAKALKLEDIFENGEYSSKGEQSIKEALGELTKLKGVGPATATTILCRCRPDIFSYMYDEVIDTFESKRDYTAKIYLRVNEACHRIAHSLGGKNWTPARVAKVLWIAARVLSANGNDMTATINSVASEDKSERGNNSIDKRERQQNSVPAARKRRKTKH